MLTGLDIGDFIIEPTLFFAERMSLFVEYTAVPIFVASEGSKSVFGLLSEPVVFVASIIVFGVYLVFRAEANASRSSIADVSPDLDDDIEVVEAEGHDLSHESITMKAANGDVVTFNAEEFSPRRVRVGDGYRWLADHDGEPVEIEADALGFDPADRARQAYVDGEIDEDELERRLWHDMDLEVDDVDE
ncbi:hypothetical protein DJ73_02215 [Halorubrum sp. Ea1]|uniref:hypothetical protein n=1 Tax=Halorubrum sp. Ea1 TaxID=1480718 RepID=UPI000B997113|nr:hypothetical protein [Halorubrum sp. Ea1]OYR55535.1 hypothetical protein DJ73_02215 [Halorubrum sp. Ea1]